MNTGTLAGYGLGSGSAVPSPFQSQYFEFNSSGMWQKPANCSLVYVEIIGAGAGGGSGRGGAGATSAGGGGGGSGSLAVFTFHAQFVPNIVPIIVGVGGAGGVAVISGSNGNAGQNGGVSNFNGILGTFLSTGGAGGTTTTAANPTTQFSNTSFTWLASDAPTLGVTTQVNPTVGARGATVTSAVLTTFGFQGNQLSGFYSTPSSSMTSITDFKPAITDPIFGMGMGGGGGCITNGVGSAGLNGATPGGGGGGGSATWSGTSGAGATGGNGQVRIWCW